MKLFATLASVALAATKEDIQTKYQGRDQKTMNKVNQSWCFHILLRS